MRISLVALMLVPALAHAVGADSCHIEGRIKGKLIEIEYADEDGGWFYENKKIGHYKYCKFIYTTENEYTPSLLNCAESKDSKQPIVYELHTTYSKGGIALEQFYICRTGCKPGIAKKLFYVCQGEG